MNTHVPYSMHLECNSLNMEQKVFPTRVLGESEHTFYTKHAFFHVFMGFEIVIF
jgi:hypothetical protein